MVNLSLSFVVLVMPGLSKNILVSCMTLLFSVLANHQIRHKTTHVKWAVSLAIVDCQLTFPRDLCGYVWVNILTLSTWRVSEYRETWIQLMPTSLDHALITSSYKSWLYSRYLTLKVLVTTIDAQWEGMGDVGLVRYEPTLLPPCPTIFIKGFKVQ